MTNGFKIFAEETGAVGQAYMNLVTQLSQTSALEKKTHQLAYISVLAATKMLGGLDFHVKSVKALGASREEVKSAVLVGLPAVGITVTDALEIALNAYDE